MKSFKTIINISNVHSTLVNSSCSLFQSMQCSQTLKISNRGSYFEKSCIEQYLAIFEQIQLLTYLAKYYLTQFETCIQLQTLNSETTDIKRMLRKTIQNWGEFYQELSKQVVMNESEECSPVGKLYLHIFSFANDTLLYNHIPLNQ